MMSLSLAVYHCRLWPSLSTSLSSTDHIISTKRSYPARYWLHSGQSELQAWERRPHAGLLRSGEYFFPQVCIHFYSWGTETCLEKSEKEKEPAMNGKYTNYSYIFLPSNLLKGKRINWINDRWKQKQTPRSRHQQRWLQSVKERWGRQMEKDWERHIEKDRRERRRLTNTERRRNLNMRCWF